jgi:hypothetical protein
MILGTIFIAVVHAPQSRRHEGNRVHGITIGYEIIGAKDQTTVLLIAGTTTHLVRLPAGFCTILANQGCQASSFVTSASLDGPATHQQVRR